LGHQLSIVRGKPQLTTYSSGQEINGPWASYTSDIPLTGIMETVILEWNHKGRFLGVRVEDTYKGFNKEIVRIPVEKLALLKIPVLVGFLNKKIIEAFRL
jgi:hypothetical protein